jgi:hypothetical protein
MIDYRELLKKYITHVGASEGVSFLETGYIYPGFHGLTPEDVAELELLNAEVIKSFVIGDLS